MADRPDDIREPIDGKTSRSICQAIGERLSRDMGPEAPMPGNLQRLIDEMRRQDGDLSQH